MPRNRRLFGRRVDLVWGPAKPADMWFSVSPVRYNGTGRPKGFSMRLGQRYVALFLAPRKR